MNKEKEKPFGEDGSSSDSDHPDGGAKRQPAVTQNKKSKSKQQDKAAATSQDPSSLWVQLYGSRDIGDEEGKKLSPGGNE